MQPDTKSESPATATEEEALPAGTQDAGAQDGPIRIVLPSGMILETYPKHMQKNIADLFGKNLLADDYDYKALRKSRMWDDEPSLPESCEVCPRRPGK